MEEKGKELNLEEMAQVAGGEEESGGCEHKNVTRHLKYDISPGHNDWGYHVKRYYLFRCSDCGQEWKSDDPNFMHWH